MNEHTLVHYAHEPLGVIRSPEQCETPDRKPGGLWLSVEDRYGWRDWCEAEDFFTGWTHIYDVELAPDANILKMDSALDIDRFHRTYSVAERYGELIKWARVAEDYEGVIIAPYQWSMRLEGRPSDWYYGWDCSSGCVWSADVEWALSGARCAVRAGKEVQRCS